MNKHSVKVNLSFVDPNVTTAKLSVLVRDLPN